MRKYAVGDEITLKKGHPCGANEWRILRTGVDIKLECLGCGRKVWLTRIEFDKRIRKIRTPEGKWISIVHYQPEGAENAAAPETETAAASEPAPETAPAAPEVETAPAADAKPAPAAETETAETPDPERAE